MPTSKKGARLGGSPAYQKLILIDLATQLIEHRVLTITEAKAKVLQSYFEELVTKVKCGDLHAHRTVAKKIISREAVYMLSNEVVPELDPEHNGGYTRLIRVGNHKGDNASLVHVEIVLEKVEKKTAVGATEATIAKAVERAKEPAKDRAAKVESTEAEVPEAE